MLPVSRTLRIFLSSTFRDFGEERDLLIKRVFPALRARLKDRFVELVDVDLRWGITEEEAERGEVLPICLAEIDRARPYFIGMLGERYGWIPPQDGFAPDLLERQPWLKKHQGGKSVTELEILHGVLKNKRMKTRAFFYFRSPAYARAKGGHYIPDTTEDKQRQLDLKRRIKGSGYAVTGYRDPEALAKIMERDLWNLLDAEFPATDVPDGFERERLRHEAYAAPRRRLYLGGESYMVALGRALELGEQRIVIEGASGGGKSALLANFFEGYRKRHPRHLVHEHYLGASADAAYPHELVRRLIEYARRVTGSKTNIPSDPQKLMDSLPIWLSTASAWALKRGTRFVIVLDSINSLKEQTDLRWWPAFLPEGVSTIVSCLPGAVMEALKGKTEALPGQKKPPKWRTVTVQPMTTKLSAKLLNAFLAHFNKKLPTRMVKLVKTHPLATNPLFLRTLAEELRLFGVHEELQRKLNQYLACKSIDDLFMQVLERVEKDCGKKHVKVAMSALWASRAGLTEKEILGVANLSPRVWAAMRLAMDESLLEIAGRITFAHDYVSLAVRDRYIQSATLQQFAHRHIGKWFTKQPLDSRRVEEEPFQWEAAGYIKTLTKALTDKGIFLLLFQDRPDELRKYWVRASEVTDPLTAYSRALRRWHAKSSDIDDGAIEAYLSLFLVNIGFTGPVAEKMARQALKKAIEIYGESSRVVGLRRVDLATLIQYRGRYSEAEELYRNNTRLRCFAKSELDQAKNLLNLGLVLKHIGNLEGAMLAYDEAERTLKSEKSVPVLQDLARLENNKAALLLLQGKNSQAISLNKSAMQKIIRVFGKDSQEAGIVLSNLASALLQQGRYQEADRLLVPAFVTAQISMGRMHPDTAHIANNLASAKFYLGDFEGAAQSASLAFESNRRSIGSVNTQTVISALNFAAILVKLNRQRKAAEVLTDVVIEAGPLWTSPRAEIVPIIIAATKILHKLGRKKVAVSTLEKFLLSPKGPEFKSVVDLHTVLVT